MWKDMVNFVKSEKTNESNELENDVRVEANEDKMVQNLRNKLQHTSEELNISKAVGNASTNIYENDVFTNRSNQVKIVKPKSYDNVEVIGEAIRDSKVIILDLNKLDTQLATRILDFVNGVCFANNIEPEKVEARIFMIDPQHKKKR